jgi:hypothetical protein
MLESSQRHDIAISQSGKVESGLTRRTARTSRASATDAFRASRRVGSRFHGNCMGKKQMGKD